MAPSNDPSTPRSPENTYFLASLYFTLRLPSLLTPTPILVYTAENGGAQ